MNCTEHRQQIDGLIDGELSTEAEREIRTHARDCDSCAGELERSLVLQGMLAAIPVEPAAAGFETRVLGYVAVQSSRQARLIRRVGGVLIAACAASVLTLAILGPQRPLSSSDGAATVPVVAMTIDEPRTINLVFASSSAVEDVALTIELPTGMELFGYEGRREVLWRTSMRRGKNYLPLELVARESASGEIVARIRHGDAERVFRIYVTAAVG